MRPLPKLPSHVAKWQALFKRACHMWRAPVEALCRQPAVAGLRVLTPQPPPHPTARAFATAWKPLLAPSETSTSTSLLASHASVASTFLTKSAHPLTAAGNYIFSIKSYFIVYIVRAWLINFSFTELFNDFFFWLCCRVRWRSWKREYMLKYYYI